MRYLIVGLLLILLLEVHGGKVPKKDRIRNHTQRHQQELQLRQKLQQREEKLGNNSQFVDGKICIGTNGRMSVPSNREHHFRNLRDRFTNCTYVDGNLEITWLQEPKLDLSFLKDIREVTGYVLISHVDVERVVLPKLQIIRGRTTFKVSVWEEEFGLFVTYSQMQTLELPALRDILDGSVGLVNNYNLCHVRRINWDEIISGQNASYRYTYNFTSPERDCSPCHSSCTAGCWGEGPENCQKFSKVTCAPQCAQGRCFGTQVRQCCHLFCAGGCTGPTQNDCIACRNFYDGGVCKQECPPMQKYNPTIYNWEPNPEGKYAYGATCVKNCPEHLLKDSGACVRACPETKMARNGECVNCDGACPKTCKGQGIVHSGNINDYKGCTIIEGSLEILQQSFDGFQQVYTNFSFGPRFIKMSPHQLEVFSTLKEITGYLNVQGTHEDFTNLTHFRNLEVIGGRQLMENMFASLYIVKTSLKSLETRSLQKINSGAVVILENSNLCFADNIDWNRLKRNQDHPASVDNNNNMAKCKNESQVCSTECTSAGCWGSGPDQCLECNHFKYNGTCLSDCSNLPRIYKLDSKTCGECHSECANSCRGPGADNCTECVNVKDGDFCVPECSETSYNDDGVCRPCHPNCVGCTGPKDTIRADGCIACDLAVISSNVTLERCLKENDTCPDGYFFEWVVPGIKTISSKAICRVCHPRCKKCTGYSFHEDSCQECTNYKRGEQCEDECNSDTHYADEENKICVECHEECNGCTGKGADMCLKCKNNRIYGDGDPSDNSTSFNCTKVCPKEYSHKIFPNEELAFPYCSAQPHSLRIEETAGVLIWVGPVLALIIALLVVIAFIICYLRAKTKNATVKMTKVLTGCEDSVPLKPSNVGPNLTKLRIIREAELRRGGILGMGAFGRVHKGMWVPDGQNSKVPVAIKVLIDMNGSESSKEFLEEAYIMASVEHPNLLQLLAVCMTSEMMLITQLMPLGCLLDYVRKNKDIIGSKALLDWSTQIAKGMCYLEENRLVHRDLAARNVLVQTPSHVKITDFGLAKLLDGDSNEYKASGGKMPIKWLALECIRDRIFTSKSDVWAFGVTVWELLTFGERPFANIEAKDLVKCIESGTRLIQPPICTLDVFMICLSCWMIDANARPTFKELYDKLYEMSKDPGRYLVIQGDKLLRLPAYTSKDQKELIRNLAHKNEEPQPIIESEEYLQPNIRSSHHHLTGSSDPTDEAILAALRYGIDPNKHSGDDETDSRGRQIDVGSIKLDLPVDEDDYLMPTCQNQSRMVPGYMDLIGVPASVDNPEYLMGADQPAPTQTIGIPITPLENEQTSDQEYYNDLQRELQPLRRSETTV